jgi:hypothetical protein
MIPCSSAAYSSIFSNGSSEQSGGGLALHPGGVLSEAAIVTSGDGGREGVSVVAQGQGTINHDRSRGRGRASGGGRDVGGGRAAGRGGDVGGGGHISGGGRGGGGGEGGFSSGDADDGSIDTLIDCTIMLASGYSKHTSTERV